MLVIVLWCIAPQLVDENRRLRSSTLSLPSILNNDADSQCGGNPNKQTTENADIENG